jgi:hypothetical protein
MSRLSWRRATPCAALLLTALGGTLLAATPAQASPTLDGCAVSLTGNTYTLTDDCTVTAELAVPFGYDLDGAGHTVTAANPAPGVGYPSDDVVLLDGSPDQGVVSNLTIVDGVTPVLAPPDPFWPFPGPQPPRWMYPYSGLRLNEMNSAVDHVRVTTGPAATMGLPQGIENFSGLWAGSHYTVSLSNVHVDGDVATGIDSYGHVDLSVFDSSVATTSTASPAGISESYSFTVQISCTRLSSAQSTGQAAIVLDPYIAESSALGQNEFGDPDNWASDVSGPSHLAPTRLCASQDPTPTPDPTPTTDPTPTVEPSPTTDPTPTTAPTPVPSPTPTPAPTAPRHRTVTASAPDRVARHQDVRFSGRVTPARQGAHVWLERLQGHRWTVAGVTTEDRQGRFRLTWRAHHRGTKTFRVLLAPQAGHVPPTSRIIHLTVR